MDSSGFSWRRFPAFLVLASSCITSSVASPTPQDSTTNSSFWPQSCCDALRSALGAKVSLPSSSAYNTSISSYWAQQETLIHPDCVVSPTSARDISTTLKVLVPRRCKFAVRGGGHGAVAGIANIEDGVTIDLRGLNAITVSSDRKTVAVGGGQKWAPVYAKLQPLGLGASGGRNGPVGVGGSTLGGGFGYFAPKVGFACDNVARFEVVLADGDIVTASSSSNPNLWRALRGGGANFGIVTQFTLNTFQLGSIWAGDAYFSAEALTAQTQALYSLTASPNFDVNAGLIVNYAFSPSTGPILTNQYAYAQPTVNPPTFQPFTSSPGQLMNSTSVTTLAAFSAAQEPVSPNGFQQITFSALFRNDLQMLRDLWNIYTASTQSIAAVSGMQWSLSLVPVPQAIGAQSSARGGNVLGLSIPPEGFIMVLLTATFSSANDYPTVQTAADQLLANIIQTAKSKGVYAPYVDMNHAGKSQDPIASYGAANQAFLKAVARQYDPTGVFQTFMPGGFKV